MLQDGVVEARDGTVVPLDADTICVHGDTLGAAHLAAGLRTGLEAAGVTVTAIGRYGRGARRDGDHPARSPSE
jgi:UPF0271 protein